MKLGATILAALALAASACAQTQTNGSIPKVRHVIGMEDVKRNASGTLTLQNGTLQFRADKASGEVPVTLIDDIFIGAETTQSGGKTGRVMKTAAMAAPFESGKALTILMRTKVDILTIAYHDPDGAVRGAIFALPKGQAEPMRAQLVQAGAHSTDGGKPSEGTKSSVGSKQ
jgi:hypothetical protein